MQLARNDFVASADQHMHGLYMRRIVLAPPFLDYLTRQHPDANTPVSQNQDDETLIRRSLTDNCRFGPLQIQFYTLSPALEESLEQQQQQQSNSRKMVGLTEHELATWNQTLQPAIYGVCSVFFVLGNVFVPMRLLSQWRTLRKILLEDYFLVAALLAADVVTVATLVAAHNGFGLHVWRVKTVATETNDMTLSKMQAIFTGIWLTSVFNGPCLISIKLGLLFFYRRLFLANQKWFRILWWLNLIYAVAWAIGSTIFFILQCSPVTYYWKRVDPTLKIHGKCSSGTHTVAIPLILSTVSDLAILILPVVVILGLQMSKENKLGLVALFGFGFVAVGCGVARLVVLEVDTDTASDPTYSTVAFEILNVVELNLAIICACVVPIFSVLRRRLGGTKQSSGSGLAATSRLKTPSGSHYRRGDTIASQPGEYLHLDDVSDRRAEITSSPSRNFSRSFANGSSGIQVKTELYMSTDA